MTIDSGEALSHGALTIRSSAEHLQAELDLLHSVLADRVAALRASVAVTEESFLGLYIPDDFVHSMLAGASRERTPPPPPASLAARRRARRDIDQAVAAAQAGEVDLPLARLSRVFELDPLERSILVVALAPEIDSRYDTLYGYVQNDATRRRATVDLVLALVADDAATRAEARARLGSGGTLVREGLVTLRSPDADGSSLARTVRVTPRIVDYLLGHGACDPELPAMAEEAVPMGWVADALPEEIAAAATRVGLVPVEGPPDAGGLSLVREVYARLGRRVLAVDVEAATRSQPDLTVLLDRVAREAKLTESVPYLGHARTCFDDPSRAASMRRELRRLAERLRGPVFVECAEDAGLAADSVARVRIPVPDPPARATIWTGPLSKAGLAVSNEAVAAVAGRYAMPARSIHAAATRAAEHIAAREVPEDEVARVLLQTASDHCHHALGSLAQRVPARPRWADVVLAPHVRARLDEVVSAIRGRSLVFEEWGFDRNRRAGLGTYALLAGPSGVGKTLSAAAIATELDLPLYRINLASVVSKYIGETEKNLARIFDEASRSHAMLFFDEADALFGKRSEVKDAHDRYANIEVAYLLQRMEAYDGAVILASNLRSNMDDAFVRRIHHVVDFPFPDAALRKRIFEVHVPEAAPVAADLDLALLARRLEITGGNIRNIVFAAATLAADEGRPISMDHMTRGALRELQKLGKLPAKADARAVAQLLRSG